jgi:organic radical activating enzyme
MKIPKIQINEIFDSVQGEGALAGFKTLFVRFQGCRVGCRWCDSKPTWKHDSKDEWKSYDLVKHITGFIPPTQWVCFTGGEPLEQGESLFWAIEKLSKLGYQKTSVETAGIIQVLQNGEIKLPDKKKVYDASITRTFFSVSPKLQSALGKRFRMESLRYICAFWYDSVENPYHLQFKFVVSEYEDLTTLRELFNVLTLDCHIFIQVEASKIGDKKFIKACEKFVKEFNYIRLTIQQHRVLQLR